MHRFTFFVTVFLVAGCTLTNRLDLDARSPRDARTEAAIRSLIEQLASGNTPPDVTSNVPFAVFPVDHDFEKEEAARNAWGQLEAFGKTAFPQLLENADDERYSITILHSVATNYTVGDVCRSVIEHQIDVAPMGYKSRQGTHGSANCPRYFPDKLAGDFRKWWNHQRHRTLREMQIEAIQWRIAKEVEIGFTSDAQQAKIIEPLLDQLGQLNRDATR